MSSDSENEVRDDINIMQIEDGAVLQVVVVGLPEHADMGKIECEM